MNSLAMNRPSKMSNAQLERNQEATRITQLLLKRTAVVINAQEPLSNRKKQSSAPSICLVRRHQ